MLRPFRALVALPIALLAACGTGDGDASGESTRDAVLVLAAASLTDVMTELADVFEQANPEITVELSFGGSSSLAVSIEEGAPGDVFASANDALTDRLVDAGLVDGEPQVFARNALVIVASTDADGADSVTSIADFERDALFLGSCAPQVPCGSYASELFDAAGVTPSIDTEEPDVRSLVAKLISGELDAGVVYASDVVAFADQLREIELPSGVSVDAEYPIAVLADAPNASGAQRFADFVAGPEARNVLESGGFDVP